MFYSASIGGVIVAFLVIAKAMLAVIPLAPGPQSLLFGALYAGGFITILSLGGTLASKQPAMTASRIAAALDEATSSEQAMFNLCEMIVKTIRSQLIALLGNYLVAFPVGFLICFAFFKFKLPLIPHTKAEHLLHDIHPFHTLSLWYAACAGGSHGRETGCRQGDRALERGLAAGFGRFGGRTLYGQVQPSDARDRIPRETLDRVRAFDSNL
jgi:site-specific recombinase